MDSAESAKYDIKLELVFERFFGILAYLDPDSGKKVRSGSGQKEPDPRHWLSPGEKGAVKLV